MTRAEVLIPPLSAAILIGGASTRMGVPKHLIMQRGKTWLERTVALVAPFAQRVVAVGGGELPPSQPRLQRLDDVPAARGPLAGLLAALRSDPGAAWVVLACDLPRLSAAALSWLVQQRNARAAGVMPVLSDGRPQPLFALYEPVAAGAVEALARQGRLAPRELIVGVGFLTPTPPPELEPAWTNVNTPEERAALDL